MRSFFIVGTLLSAAFVSVLNTPVFSQENTPENRTSHQENFEFPELGTAPIITSVDEITRITRTHGSELLIVNFWATFCGPCVEELPYFVALAENHPPEQVRVLGISVDLRRDVETRVIPFLRERGINFPNVVLFGDQQETIEFFSEVWSGEIPATFFFDGEGNKLAEVLGPMTQQELNNKVAEMQKKIGG